MHLGDRDGGPARQSRPSAADGSFIEAMDDGRMTTHASEALDASPSKSASELAPAGSMCNSWPSDTAWFYRDVLSSSGKRAMRVAGGRARDEDGRSELDALAARVENYWIPMDVLKKGVHGDGPVVGVEACVCEVYRRVVRSFLEDKGAADAVVGVEFWSQVYKKDKKVQEGLAFHFDKDERMLAETGEMSHPMFSSVLYLHDELMQEGSDGSASIDELCMSSSRLGATLVMDQRHSDGSGECSVAEEEEEEADDGVSRRDVLCYPRFNSLFIFDGALAHGVLESTMVGGPQRKTLLMNWWCRQPIGVERIGDASDAGLSMYDGDVGDDDDDDGPRRMRIEKVDVDVDEPTRLETVLSSHFKSSMGSERLTSMSVDAVAFMHPRSHLYHVEEPAGAVYFVPDHCLEGGADEED